MTRRTVAIAAGVIVAIAVLALWPREPPGPRERIERRVVQMTDAAEKKDVGGVLEGVSERFRGAQGWGKDQLRGVLVAQLLRGKWVRVFLTDLDIQLVSDSRGEVSGTFLFTRADAVSAAELSRKSVVDAWTVEGGIQLEADGEWRFVDAKHRRADLQELLLP